MRVADSPRKRRMLAPLLITACTGLAALGAFLDMRYIAAAPVREHLQKGIAMAGAGNPRGAEQEWRASLRLDPFRPEAYQLLSRLYLDTGQAEKAIPLLEQLRKLSPQSPHVMCGLAEAYTRAGMAKKGLDTARQAVIIEPDCPRAHALLGIYLGDQEDTRSALRELSRAVALAPKDDKIAISYAQAQLDASDWPAAERTARRVIARNPNYATAWYSLGRSYSRRDPTPDNLREAIAAYTRSVELNPAFGDAWAELGRLKVLSGDYKGAIASLEFIWKRGVKTKEAAFNLATAYRRAGNEARAEQVAAEFKRISDFSSRLEALEKHLSVEPNNLEVALQLGEMDIQSGNLPDAATLVEAVLHKRPHDPRALKAAAELYKRMGQPDLAQAYSRRLASAQSTGKVESR